MGCNICDSTGHELDARGFCPFCGGDVDNGLRVLIGGWETGERPWTILAIELGERWNGFQTPVFDSFGMWEAMGYLAQYTEGVNGWGFTNDGDAFIRDGGTGVTEIFKRDENGNYSFAGHGYAWESYTG